MTPKLDRNDLSQILATLEAAVELRTYGKIAFFEPYVKQWDFIALGTTRRERLLMAANQVGKSETGAFETACHLTGKYPKGWVGRIFRHPVRGWAAGETSTLVRDVSQKKLCGEPGVDAAYGTGMIPKNCFAGEPSLARGVTDAFDTIQVKHYTDGVEDGISILRFKSYEQGRKKFQGETLDFVWCDEEPPADIYSEILTRTTATKGMVFVTFTPLQGMSSVVTMFLHEESPDRGVIQMTIDDAKHIDPAEKAKIIAGYRPHEREARARGVPMLGSGRIFEYTEESITEPPLEYLPREWTKLWGVDFGIDHPFAAVLTAWDRENDVIHVIAGIRVSDQLPLQHAVPMKMIAAGVPVAWPHDGNNRDKGGGEQLAKQYKARGLHMLDSHATWPDGGISTEAGIMEMQERMTTGRFKVSASMADWFEEYRMYHRKDGLIVKTHDDLLSATRICVMAKRHGQAMPIGSKDRRNRQSIANDVDFDMF